VYHYRASSDFAPLSLMLNLTIFIHRLYEIHLSIILFMLSGTVISANGCITI